MLAHNSQTMHSEMQRLVQEILLEDSRFKRDLRSFHREVLVSPVVLRFADNLEEQHHCVSRNISPAGIALISSFPVEESARCQLELYRLSSPAASEVLAECRWCRPFGPSYWITGWQFLQLLVP